MNPNKLIQSKINGDDIPKSKMESLIYSYVNGDISDDIMVLFLKAIHTHGMTNDEIFALTEVMVNSGEKVSFSNMDSYIADKHSTGGVGDKVSLVLGPLMAAAGLVIPMLAGKSLGHTGGTIDKLETIPGFQSNLTIDQFKLNVDNVGVCIMSQTESICPADRKMYALRDVTGTIDSIPLICGSIMSKKIAEGIQGLVLDIKTGNGAFMDTMEKAVSLGDKLKDVGEKFGVKTNVVYSSMNQPLGRSAGMWCEVAESIESLMGNGPNDLMNLVYELGGKLLVQAGITRSETAAISIQENLIHSGKALIKFEKMVEAQNGDLTNYKSIHQPNFNQQIIADEAGYIKEMNTLNIGWGAVELGCGRRNQSDCLDSTAGIKFFKKIGDRVEKGEPIMECFNSNHDKLCSALSYLNNSVLIGTKKIRHNLFL